MPSYNHISTNTTTVIANSGCRLIRLTINTKGATGNTLTLYDHPSAASGDVIAVIDTTSSVGDMEFGAMTTKGLVAVTATGTAADITVMFD